MRRNFGVAEWLRESSPEWLETVFFLVTHLGDWRLVVPALAVLYLADIFSTLREPVKISGGQPLCSDRTVFLIATVFGGLALTYLLKTGIGAPRPPEQLHAVPADSPGVPSGHAMGATIFWGALALWLPAGSRHIRTSGAGIAIVLVALSRLGLGVHFLGDVVAGLVFGLLYLAVVGAVLADNPAYVFGCAIAIAAAGVLVSGAEGQALLALGGTIGAAAGWRGVESQPVRQFLTRAIAPMLQK